MQPFTFRGASIAWLATALAGGVAGGAIPKPEAIDRVFSAWTGTDRPGCALSVARNGELVLARGYGMANLEAGVANGPETVFDLGSVSKQFTAMAVLLLVVDGRLSLDDDIRRYLPEIPDYGAVITVRHLLQHTSGLRNYTDLFDLAGVPEVSLTTRTDALNLIARQDGVNFRPGEQFLYSDTNYFLAGEIVHRVSGKSLREFADERIFAPLGMSHTHYIDQPREIVVRRAIGYEPVGTGYHSYLSNFEQVGDGAVLSTVLDMVRWQHNFEDPRVGGPAAVALMTKPGTLNDGTATPYGMGLFIDNHRGLPWIHHGGEWVGYRAAASRFPDERLSVVVLCNTIGTLDPTALSLDVADLLTADRGDDAAKTARPSSLAAQEAGLYWSPEQGTIRRFEADGGILTLGAAGSGEVLQPVAPRVYRTEGEDATEYRFRAPGPGADWSLEAESFGNRAHYYRLPVGGPGTADLAGFAGRYASRNLPFPWELVVEDGVLRRRQVYLHDVVLDPIFADTFVGALSEGYFLLHFVRDPAGAITGALVSGELMRPLLLVRQSGAGP